MSSVLNTSQHLALVSAALFTGAATYINVAEQPALDNTSLLATGVYLWAMP